MCITNANLIAYNKIPRFDFNNHNISQAVNLTDAEVKCSNYVPTKILQIQNPAFELGLYGWDIYNEASIVSEGCRSGKYCVRVGKITATNGESKISQTFIAATGLNLLSFWYKMTCPDTVQYDWMSAVLIDHTTDTTWNMPKTCETSITWKLVTTNVIPGHSYTLSLINNDDNSPADPSNTLFDDISLSPSMFSSCVGYNSAFWYKNDLQNPTISVSNFYVHSMTIGMSFAQLVDWDNNGSDISGTSLILPDTSTCAYLCTITTGCVGAVWDPTQTKCWLKASYGPPTRVSNRNMLIPVGSGGCPTSVIASGNCIHPSYNIIPNFDFAGSTTTISVAVDLSDAVINCTQDTTCMGFNSNYFLKRDFAMPTISVSSDFYIHAVAFGMQFALVKGWNSDGKDVSGYIAMPITTTNAAHCAYLCTREVDCVGAVWDGVVFLCWLKSCFGPPSQSSTRNLLIPAGSGGCSSSVIVSGNCIQSTLSNKVPNFDFIGENANMGVATDMTDAIDKCFLIDLTCVGFNGTLYRKSDFTGPVTSHSDFYVNIVTSTSSFAHVIGWDSDGIDLPGYAGLVLSNSIITDCAYLCASTSGCVGAVWDPAQTKCWLKASYGPPTRVSNRNMLIPVGSDGCPASVIASGNCVTPVNDDVTILCQIMVEWKLYSHKLVCFNRIELDYSSRVSIFNGRITRIDFYGLNISGSISTVLSQLTNLQYLSLYNNQLSGTIPSELSQLTNLQYLYLYNNQLSGTIPSELSQITNLQYLYLYNNQLSGTIPSKLSQLTNLQYLSFYINQLSGTIPSELSQLTNLQYLSFYNNQLTGTIPSELSQLTNLQYLNLNINQLSGTIPSKLSQLTNLQYLSLYNNQLTGTIPSELSQLTNLQYLSFYINQLSGTIPSELSQLTNLQYLSLYNNQLTGTIPSKLSQLTNLQYLSFYINQLSGTIPSELSQLTNLQSLVFSNNQLSGTIPSELSQLTNLQSLLLNNNKLSGTIPSKLSQLTNLQYLNLYNNQLSGTIPSELSQLTNLQYLSLYNNQLTGTIPSELSQLTNLQYLSFYINQLSGTIPSELSQLTNLQYLSLDNNQLAGTIPSELSQITNLQNLFLDINQLSGTIPSELSQLTNLQYLSLYNNQLTDTIPSELSQLTNLQYLNLYNNQLSGTIPSELSQLTNLQYLSFYINQLSGTIPSELSQLTNLQYLSLYNNQLTGTIPSKLSQLTNLQYLSFYINQLSGTIPSELSQLTNLQSLVFSNNQLSGTIPSELSQLTNLQSLLLNNNKLSGTIPSKLSQLTNLQYLNLYNNQLSGTIPSELSQLTNLQYLSLYNNQLTGTIPSKLSQLTNLQYLSFYINQLSGTIPSELSQLTNLQYLSLDNNQLAGTIPSELSQITNLQNLFLDINQLSGTIPSELSQLTNLQYLSLYNNQLTDTIPSELSQLTNLQYLNLYNNQLSGTIPSELSQLTNLQSLLLNNNKLSGTIPSKLSQLTNLQYLNLYNNQLSGTIPSELCQLTNLQYLSLYNNQLTGTIPSELSQLTNLQYLSFYINQLSGTIPSELSQLTNLQYLNLNNNQLAGTIPSELSQLTNLQYLFLDINQLSGTIPSELSQLTSLLFLDLDNNQLTGTIPSELSQLTNLQYLNLYNNQLSGTIPSELSQLTNLQLLDFSNNQLTGTIPSELSQLTNLQYLSLDNNQLTGTIPSQSSQMIQLYHLHLQNNKLTGTIPYEIGQFTLLTSLLLHNNQLTGIIPTHLGLLKNLLFLFIPDNQLSGTFPTEICQLTVLKTIGLYGNKLSGTFPTQLAQLRSLETLNIDNNLLTISIPDELVAYLNIVFIASLDPVVVRPVTHNSNSFTGSLPSEMGLMKSLQNIYIENNLITGSLPSEFGLLSALKSISMTSNQLTGTIPSEFGNLQWLAQMRLSNNQLSGTIPSELGFLSSIVDLYLSSNQLTGSISKELSKLTTLKQLQLSHNQLTGTIDKQFGRLNALQNFDVSTNQLIGSLPSELANLKFLQYLRLDHNAGLNGTVTNSICLIQSLVLITVSIGVSCPTNCSGKCSKFEFYNPSVVPMYSPSILPTNLRIAQASSSSSLNTGSIIGIVVGIFTAIFVIVLMLYCFIWVKDKTSERMKDEPILETYFTNDTILNSFAKQNSLKVFSWDDFVTDTEANCIIGEGSFGVVVRSKLIVAKKVNLSKEILKVADKDLVIKIIKNEQLGDTVNTELEHILKEVQIHVDTARKIVNKDCIVKLYGLVEGQLPTKFSRMLNVKTALGIVMRYEAGGSLNSILYTDISKTSSKLTTATALNSDARTLSAVTASNSDSKTSDNVSAFTSSIISSKQVELSLVQKFYVLHKVAQSLAELHKAGTVHGDLKPDNILLSSKDILQAEIRLADFGCSDLRDKNAEIGMSSLARTVHQRGTPIYSAPEQMFNPSLKSKNSNSNMIATYAKPSIKTDIYSFAVLSWEILTQHKPYSNISSPTELAVVVHQGIRPDIQLLPTDCPVAVKNMIERCWHADRSSRLTALECFTTLRDCYILLSTIKYDIYLAYRNSKLLQVINRVRDMLIENGFKVASFENFTGSVNKRDELNQRIELIKQSKIVLLCLEHETQTDNVCIYELGNNRGFRRPRPVIPLFLEPRNEYFPDNEIKVHCYMGRSDTKIFDVSSFNDSISSINSEHVKIAIEGTNVSAKTNVQIGIDPFDMEINRLIEHIHFKLNEDHVRY